MSLIQLVVTLFNGQIVCIWVILVSQASLRLIFIELWLLKQPSDYLQTCGATLQLILKILLDLYLTLYMSPIFHHFLYISLPLSDSNLEVFDSLHQLLVLSLFLSPPDIFFGTALDVTENALET